MGNTNPNQPPRSVDEVLGTSRIPNDFVGFLLDRYRVTDANGAALINKQYKGGGIHSFLGCLTDELAPVPGLAGPTLLGVDQDG